MVKGESDPLIKLAKMTVEEYVRHGKVIDPDSVPIPDEMNGPAGCFVTLKINGQLRGCIGTIEPVHSRLCEEIVSNAISSATRDPRFNPVRPDELDKLEYSVDVLSKPERVFSLRDLDPKVYGVIVENGLRRGVLLPDLEGVDTVEEQVSIAMQKAGIYPDEPIVLYRFTVERHE